VSSKGYFSRDFRGSVALKQLDFGLSLKNCDKIDFFSFLEAFLSWGEHTGV
jgi:hypothetical protein